MIEKLASHNMTMNRSRIIDSCHSQFIFTWPVTCNMCVGKLQKFFIVGAIRIKPIRGPVRTITQFGEPWKEVDVSTMHDNNMERF
jgi:hypothetical protein